MGQDNRRQQDRPTQPSGDQVVEKSTALTKFDEDRLKGIATAQETRAVFLPANFAECMEMAKLMASGFAVPPYLRGRPSECMAVSMQAFRWGMDPYAVASKSYFVNDMIAYEAQLVNAVINMSGAIIGRLRPEWQDYDDERKVRVTIFGRLAADPEHERALSMSIARIKTKNSPLWSVNPGQQLAYWTMRAWVRLYAPEVLLGVYTKDEIEDGAVAAAQDRVSGPAEARPDRRSFQNQEGPADSRVEDAHFEPVPAENEADSGAGTAADEGGKVDAGAAEPVQADQEVPAERDEMVEKWSAIPVEPLEWSAWEADLRAEIERIQDIPTLNKLRRAVQPALDQAPDGKDEELHSLFMDRACDLPTGAAK